MGRAVFLDQIGTLAEPLVVFRIVSAGFCNVIVQVQKHLVAHPFPVVDGPVALHQLPQTGIQIFALALQLQKERLMIDAGAEVVQLLVRNAQPAGQHLGGTLDAVAETGDVHLRLGLHGAAEHGHGIGVVKEHRVRTVFFDIAADIQHQRDVAQRTENAGHTAGIAHVGIHTVALGNFNLVAPHVDIAVKHRTEYAVRPRQCFFSGKGGRDLRFRTVHGRADLLTGGGDAFQPVGIDIHQSEFRIVKGGKRQQIPHDIAGKDEAACSDKGDFFHDTRSCPKNTVILYGIV